MILMKKGVKNMIDVNIKFFRKNLNMTQEQLAERLNVTRQTVAKWESGEATPNIADCANMAQIFQITVDDLIKDMNEEELAFVSPKGKHLFGIVTVGDRGQIVIPKDARKIFNIETGDKLIVLGDEQQGIAIVKADAFHSFARHIIKKFKDRGDL